jgi:hypothetical protein
MQKITMLACVAALVVMAVISSCKKSTPAPVVKTGNYAHDLTDSFYIRDMVGGIWQYYGNNNAEECQNIGGVCASMLTYYHSNIPSAVKIDLIDSGIVSPKDSTIMSWAGKTFSCTRDTLAGTHPYLFRFSMPDTSGIMLSSNYCRNDGASLTVTSVVRNGLSHYYSDSTHTPYKAYKIKGTFSCNLAHLGDTIPSIPVTQGIFSINVIEAK